MGAQGLTAPTLSECLTVVERETEWPTLYRVKGDRWPTGADLVNSISPTPQLLLLKRTMDGQWFNVD
jgi:hypothetical protein